MTIKTTTMFAPTCPLPAGADEVLEWNGRPGVDADATRCFRGFHRVIAAVPVATAPGHETVPSSNRRPWSRPIEVYVQGVQYGDGRVQRGVAVNEMHSDYPVTAEQAEELAAALLDAARALRAAEREEGASA